MPEPDKLTVSGELGASLVIVRDPLMVPSALGVKVAVTFRLEFVVSLTGNFGAEMLNGPETVMPLTVMMPIPALVTARFWVGLLLPT